MTLPSKTPKRKITHKPPPAVDAEAPNSSAPCTSATTTVYSPITTVADHSPSADIAKAPRASAPTTSIRATPIVDSSVIDSTLLNSLSKPMARITRYQAKLQEQKPFRFLDLSQDIRYMVFDELVPKKIYLRTRYTGVGGNSAVALVVKLLCINHQLRQEALDYIYRMKPVFSISIHDAYSFPLPLEVRRLELRTVELDQKTMFRSNNPEFDCLPTEKTRNAIQMFGQCWAEHCIEELDLHFLMAPNTEYRGVAYGTNLTVMSVFAPLGHFNKVQAHYSLKNIRYREEINCKRAFRVVAKILLPFLRQSNSDRS